MFGLLKPKSAEELMREQLEESERQLVVAAAWAEETAARVQLLRTRVDRLRAQLAEPMVLLNPVRDTNTD